jgi:hypothetical protein
MTSIVMQSVKGFGLWIVCCLVNDGWRMGLGDVFAGRSKVGEFINSSNKS